jgi:hypothetical protein
MIFNNLPPDATSLLFLVLSFWALIWKGMALWVASRTSQKYWFMILLILNTLGIVEIIYLIYTARKQKLSLRELLTKNLK